MEFISGSLTAGNSLVLKNTFDRSEFGNTVAEIEWFQAGLGKRRALANVAPALK